MDSRVKSAMEAEAMSKSAQAIADIVPKLAETNERLARIEAILQANSAKPNPIGPRDNSKGGR